MPPDPARSLRRVAIETRDNKIRRNLGAPHRNGAGSWSVTAPFCGVSVMFKRLVLIARKADHRPEQFQTHWSGPHADIIKKIIAHFPDAEKARYTQNRVH